MGFWNWLFGTQEEAVGKEEAAPSELEAVPATTLILPERDNTEQDALGELLHLLKLRGALKVITNEVRPELREDAFDTCSSVRPAVLAADPLIYKKASTFVIHDVIRILPTRNGRYRAYTKQGDWCEGRPSALLKRLQEWRTE